MGLTSFGPVKTTSFGAVAAGAGRLFPHLKVGMTGGPEQAMMMGTAGGERPLRLQGVTGPGTAVIAVAVGVVGSSVLCHKAIHDGALVHPVILLDRSLFAL